MNRVSNINDFEILYKKMYGPLVNFCYSKTRDWTFSEEIVQNVFSKIWCNRNDIIIKTSIKNYLFSMVSNNIVDEKRKVKNIVDIEEEVIENTFKADNDYAALKEDIEYDYECHYAIKKGIESLKPKRRKIFGLSKFEGLTYKEIAYYLDISERAVEDNICKAYFEIREFLKDYNFKYKLESIESYPPYIEKLKVS